MIIYDHSLAMGGDVRNRILNIVITSCTVG